MTSSADSLEFFEFDSIANDKRLLECPVCLDPWRSPQEVSPCGHIFCRVCLRNNNSATCMVCRSPITEFKPPNRYLVQMALALSGKCTKCEWKGTAEQFEDTRHATVHRASHSTHNGGGQESLSAHPPIAAVATAPPSCSSSANRSSSSEGREWRQQPSSAVWDEYGLKKTEYDLVISAIASSSRHHAIVTATPSTSSPSSPASQTAGSKTNRSVGFAGARSFARLMGYPSTTTDIQHAFQEFGADPTNGTLNDHQLLLWSSTMSHRRRSELSFGLNHTQLLDILCELHESVDFRKHVGVITTPQLVGYIRSCRTAALLAGDVLLPPAPPASTASADVSLHRSIYLSTRGRVGDVNGGYPDNGVLLVDVLEALASEDDGFELCAASPRGEAPPQQKKNQSLTYTALPQQEQQSQAPNVESRPMAGGPYHYTPTLQQPPPQAPYYAPLHPSVANASHPVPYLPYRQPVSNAPYVGQAPPRPNPYGYPYQQQAPPQHPPPPQSSHHQRHVGGQGRGCPYQQQPQPTFHHGMPQPTQVHFGIPPQVNYYGMPPPPAQQQPYYGY
jgi:hypothetical protein